MNIIEDLPSKIDYRYERKFYITQLSRYETESIVKLHPAAFSEIYAPRFVNNVYFDTVGMSAYQENLIGISDRVKTRIRWYGELFGLIKEPVLELKIKRGILGGKLRYPLAPITLDSGYSLRLQQEMFARADISERLRDYLESLKFALLNRYHRKYFRSADGKFRITIDFDMEFYRIDPANNCFAEKAIDRTSTILELKYAEKDDEEARSITNLFPVRMTKSSKYVTGIEGLYVPIF